MSAAFIEESYKSPIGDDDKIYFFFTEVAKEFTYFNKVVVSRIARVCKASFVQHYAYISLLPAYSILPHALEAKNGVKQLVLVCLVRKCHFIITETFSFLF